MAYDLDALKLKLQEEEDIADELATLDLYWQEISTILLAKFAIFHASLTQLLFVCSAADDIENEDEVRFFLQKLKEVRQKKLDAGLTQLDSRPMAVTFYKNSHRLIGTDYISCS
jgi:sulfite reductase alpha subunit-like flavoprotein